MPGAIEAATEILLRIEGEAEGSEAGYAALAADPAAVFGRHGLDLAPGAAVDIHRASNGHVFIGVDLRSLSLEGAPVQAIPVVDSVDLHDRHFSDCYFNAGDRTGDRDA
ncbi:MAG: hypothetical protein RIB84_15845 [Sneathiellaceae bacterium]